MSFPSALIGLRWSSSTVPKPSFEIVGHYGLLPLFLPIFLNNYRNATGHSFSPNFTSLTKPHRFHSTNALLHKSTRNNKKQPLNLFYSERLACFLSKSSPISFLTPKNKHLKLKMVLNLSRQRHSRNLNLCF